MFRFLSRFFLLLLLFAPFLQFPAALEAAASDSNLLARAQEEFSRRKYEEAMLLLRAYLRKHPKDQDAWTRFAATYYHTGQANYALQYLLKAKSSPELRIFNMYYRALCYDALGDEKRADRLLRKVIKSEDPLAEDALFEKAAIEFDTGDKQAAKDTARDYLRRYRGGRHRAQADFILKNIDKASKVDVPESQRTLYRSSYFQVHPYSLMPIPHSWVYQLGFFYKGGQEQSPTLGNTGTEAKDYEEIKILSRIGLALGPFTKNWSSTTVGYFYSQDWLSDSDRTAEYLEDPTDLEYFLFRPDMQERSHRFYLDSSGSFGPVKAGAYAHFEFVRGGSSLFPAPERPEIRRSFDIRNGTMLAPYVDWEVIPDHRLRFSLLLEKVFDSQQSAFSYKTYNFTTDDEDRFASMLIQEHSYWPDYGIRASFEIFRLSSLYNDFWEGSSSIGGATRFEWEPIPYLRFSAKVGYASRDYLSEAIKSSPCNQTPQQGPRGPAQAFACPRHENTLKAEGSANFFSSKHSSFSVVGGYEKTENDTLKVYDDTSQYFMIRFSQAFPDLRTGAQHIEPPRGLFQTREFY